VTSERLAYNHLSDHQREEIDGWLSRFPDHDQGRQSAVIPALHIAQEGNGGWLSNELLDAVADYLNLAPVRVYEVATFYSMFQLQPVGRHKVNICQNISCMLCGADGLVEHVEQHLGIKLGETTPDGRITLIPEDECLAACTEAPMMLVDEHYYTDLTPEKATEILDSLE
jgi:NADH-quinone oxidoreductase subunit E